MSDETQQQPRPVDYGEVIRLKTTIDAVIKADLGSPMAAETLANQYNLLLGRAYQVVGANSHLTAELKSTVPDAVTGSSATRGSAVRKRADARLALNALSGWLDGLVAAVRFQAELDVQRAQAGKKVGF